MRNKFQALNELLKTHLFLVSPLQVVVFGCCYSVTLRCAQAIKYRTQKLPPVWFISDLQGHDGIQYPRLISGSWWPWGARDQQLLSVPATFLAIQIGGRINWIDLEGITRPQLYRIWVACGENFSSERLAGTETIGLGQRALWQKVKLVRTFGGIGQHAE